VDGGTNDRAAAPNERRALAVLRVALGTLFVWVFFENLGKGAYSPSGYKGVIDFYLKNGHAPAAWKAIMSVLAANSAVVAPLQAVTELTFGVCLLTGTATRLVAAAAGAFLFTLWLSELGTAWIWELAMPIVVAFSLSLSRAGRTWGIDAVLARRYPTSPIW
jgi:uncharacterized membrane protein YphA (DoxX/SURF4 family)